jgi:hypothetical protein
MNSISSRASVPNPTPLLFVMAAIVAWYKWGDDGGPISAAAASLVVAIVAASVVYVLSMRPVLAVIALVAAGTMARLYVEIFGMKARPEHFAIVLVCLAVPFWPREQWRRPRWILPDLLLALYMASNLVSSLVMSIAPSKTLTWAAQQVLVILPYFLLRFFCTNRERFRKAFMILLAVGAAQAAIGVFCFFSNLVFGSEFGMEMGQYGTIPGTYGFEYEANILGAISAAAFVMMLVTYLQEHRRILLWGIAITYAGMLIALSRAAIVAAFIALGLLIAISIRTKLLDGPAAKALAKTLLLANMLLLPVVAPLYQERFSTLEVSDVSSDGDTAVRVITLVSASDGIMSHPMMGNGTSSFQLLVSNQEIGFSDLDGGTWIGNTEMRVLHDTGILGLTVFLCFLGSLALRARKILQRELRLELLALLTACAVYALTFQATEGTLLEFFWVHVGLLGCAVSIYHNPPSKEADSKVGGGPSGDACA